MFETILYTAFVVLMIVLNGIQTILNRQLKAYIKTLEENRDISEELIKSYKDLVAVYKRRLGEYEPEYNEKTFDEIADEINQD